MPRSRLSPVCFLLQWEVLNGVGVDGVGVIFPFFYAFFHFSMHFSPCSSLFSASPKGQGQTTAIYCKNGEFHSDPVCTDPIKNFPIQNFRKGFIGQRGLARGHPSKARDSGLFSAPFFLCPLKRTGTHFWKTFWAPFGGLFVANTLPPTPFRNLRLLFP